MKPAWVVGGVAVLGIVLGGAWFATRAPVVEEPVPVKRVLPPVAPVEAPVSVPHVPDDSGRVSFETGRNRVQGLPKIKLNELENAKDLHAEAIQEVTQVVLKPCVPRRPVRQDGNTRRLEIDYFLQPTGIVELRVRGVGADRLPMEVDPDLLDCVGTQMSKVAGPAVQGELHHRFVYAYSAATP